MFTFLNSKSLWTGSDMEKFSQIRTVLENNSIRYKYKVTNRLGQIDTRGTSCSTIGGFGNPVEQMYQYEIFVHEKDFERALYFIK